MAIQQTLLEAVRHAFYIPYLKARLIPADKRKVYHTSMNWEVYPEAIYEMIKKFSAYSGVKKVSLLKMIPHFLTGLKMEQLTIQNE